jgi:hypothetical protein
MNRYHLLAAEIFGYRYDNYEGNLGSVASAGFSREARKGRI